MASTVVFTSSYNKNKNGLYPAHIVDVIADDNWDTFMLDWWDHKEQYTSILSPTDSNFKYWLDYKKDYIFKKDHVATGRRRYKLP